MNKIKACHLMLLLSILVPALAGCSAPVKYWSSKTAQVLDKNTKEPIADVHVITKWIGRRTIGFGRSECYHVETAKTDQN